MSCKLQEIYYGKFNFLFLFVTFVTFPYTIRSDLPVHCLVSEIEGLWDFSISQEQFIPSLKDQKTTCGHGFPDRIETTVGDTDYPFNGASHLTIEIKGDYNIYQDGEVVGNWTPVYDQSFVIFYKNSIITAAYKYYKDPQTLQYVSNCGKTMVGWIIHDKNNKEENWSCLYGTKRLLYRSHAFLQKTQKLFFPQMETNNFEQLLKYEQLSPVVKQINEANLIWKAEVYPEHVGLSFLELREKLGLKKKFPSIRSSKTFSNIIKSPFPTIFLQNASKSSMIRDYSTKDLKEFLDKLNQDEPDDILPSDKQIPTNKIPESSTDNIDNEKQEQDSPYVTEYAEIIKYLDKPLDEIDEHKLPKNWDWRDVGGKNFIPKTAKQKNCGSCYVFSAVTSLEARLRIKTNNQDQTSFSKQFPISCNFYAEGCEGGYPYLVGKFFNEFEVVPEECFRYTQTNNKCSNVCDYTKYKKKYHVSEYGYLGGFYGGTNEELMKKEIRARGPIPGNLLVPGMFNYYKTGIFSVQTAMPTSKIASKIRMIDRKLSWEKVEHSITLVGYGEENGVKYWIGQNTWGSSWGDNGFFKILRGENECSIESMGDYLDIEVLSR